MKIIELTETQFKNYSKLHSSRNYLQTIEYANVRSEYQRLLLGFIDESNNTLMAATLILEKRIGKKYRFGFVPGGFLVDYSNDSLLKDFVLTLKDYLKEKNFIYLTVQNLATYKMYDREGKVIYYDTNVLKLLDELSFVKISKEKKQKVVLETEKTPNETYKMFDANTRRNIKLSLQRAITIYKDENNNPEVLLNLVDKAKNSMVESIIKNFNTESNKAEIYFAKIDPEKYINNYRFLLKEEEEKNDNINAILQDINTKKSVKLINKKMASDKLITKYNNEIIRATNLYAKYPEGKIIGAILIIKNNREIYFMNEGRLKEFPKINSSHLIKWEIIKKYLTEGYKIFNFGYIKNIHSKNGNYSFKMGFGGKVYESIGTYDMIINKYFYRIFKLLAKK